MPILKSNFSLYENQTQRLHWLTTPQNKELLYYATSAGRETWKKDYYIKRQEINLYMINYVLGGAFRLTVDGREMQVCKGDLCFLHLVNEHEIVPLEDKTEIIYFHLLGGQVKEIYDAFLEKGDFVIHGVPADLLTGCFNNFSAAIDTEDGFYTQSRTIYYLLTELLRLRSVETQNKYPKLIEKILCYILYTCPLPSPAEVARQFGFSPIYLERLFKKYVGQSVQSYILKQKYAFACRFLADTDMSVAEVAREVGYEDSKGLIVLFSKFGTLTPLAYRKKMRERHEI